MWPPPASYSPRLLGSLLGSRFNMLRSQASHSLRLVDHAPTSALKLQCLFPSQTHHARKCECQFLSHKQPMLTA
ncbi:hypothetical protein BCR37DRAFT_377828 [Protomyces lactucae-debilis]|uniref:Uncharacterized protein n=1 Tax=Protomyces lactucae-debilis TaxID=2754530 RepID=A0A1Y2FQD0_PROLT|nr:uncharacterized protein BCR37DRAFT_377828 [Protomyces lactucae-debilis]ORY84915.1 hypothetical protein BCR37DRAFT_377828 [Protomyces lactucae-debilis]